MADFLQLISTLREQMNATLSRSDVLRPLAWLIGILTTAIILMVVAKGPEWLLILMSVLLVFSIGIYFFAYVFCLFRDRDALRSEKYSLHSNWPTTQQRFDAMCSRDADEKKPASEPKTPDYNKEAVNKAIAASNRSGQKIGGKEASKIHALLKGRY